MTDVTEADWVSRFADQVIAEVERRARRPAVEHRSEARSGDRHGAAPMTQPGKRIVCASGLSPSGPIHLGNLREVMTPHLVADEIRRRGIDVEHLISFDDYDRYRKVPSGIDPAWAQHVGKPLTSVPAPPGSSHPNWAEHFKAEIKAALAELGVTYREISQTQMYTSGAYTQQILTAMRERHTIDEILNKYRTKRRSAKAPAAAKPNSSKLNEDDAIAAAEAAEGSGAASEDEGGAGASYYPYRPYCSACDRDLTTVTAYDDETSELTYVCACGHGETVVLRDHRRGKLVWKVDWPMRWAYEGVDFEPSGVDHSSPGSSYQVGGEIVGPVFGGIQPIGPMYAFVGIKGMAKMSSSRGGVPIPGEALEIMEAPLLRWLYARRRPNQSFLIAFDQEIQRMYDEWDALSARIASGAASAADSFAYSRAAGTADGPLPSTPRPLPYRTLASIVDVTTGDPEQTLRIVRDLDREAPIASLDETRPRLDKATAWVLRHMPERDRTRVREEPDTALLAVLDEGQRESLRMLAAGLDDNWSLDGLTTLVYGVPKRLLGLPMDVVPTPELKAAQRAFFALVYRLLVTRDTGPRLPTLLLAVGADRVRKLLGA